MYTQIHLKIQNKNMWLWFVNFTKKNNPDEDTQEMLSIPVKVVKLISHNIYLESG